MFVQNVFLDRVALKPSPLLSSMARERVPVPYMPRLRYMGLLEELEELPVTARMSGLMAGAAAQMRPTSTSTADHVVTSYESPGISFSVGNGRVEWERG